MSKFTYQIKIAEKHGIDRRAYPIEIGIPLPRGRFFSTSNFSLLTSDDDSLPLSASATALWPDNSVKWCFLRSCISVKAYQELSLLVIESRPEDSKPGNHINTVSGTDETIDIQTRNLTFSISKKNFDFIKKIVAADSIYSNSGYFKLDIPHAQSAEIKITDYTHTIFHSDESVISTSVTVNAIATCAGRTLAKLTTVYHFFYESDSLRCEFTIHNPNPAQHDSGLWDLGDPGSLIFKSLKMGIEIEEIEQLNWKDIHADHWNSADPENLSITQFSSGGKNWDSPVHKEQSNKVPFDIKGYIVSHDQEKIDQGFRISPLLCIDKKNISCHAYIENFWQNFPKSLQVEKGLHFHLFPEQKTHQHELQGGERKTHCMHINFGVSGASVSDTYTPLEIRIDSGWIKNCNVLNSMNSLEHTDYLQNIIQQGLEGDNNFFQKRENVDEYGWRNFGDLYADHESDLYSGTDIFVSHFNNQYDPLYGFLKQYLISEDYRWFKLADDLARHVIDIDIYHTQFDRDEYNNGLFWHTDHYLEAETSTHRSYSNRHPVNAYEGHARGGGPGGQHCYTGGLLLHYLITGNTASRNALLELTNWVSKIYEGNGTLLDVLVSVKNRNRPDLKNIFLNKYPLDRGTGNYINALLDSYYLNQQQSVIDLVAYIIKHTVHPDDNIDERQLSNVEETWFYTVFFQAVCRYLLVKVENEDLDDDFYYCRDTLLHYANWMVEHEYPYLEKPDILEFPNHTWTAQDIRKAYILYWANYFDPEHSKKYISKADEIYSYIEQNLANEPTRTYTRILAILMQNHGFKNQDFDGNSFPTFDPIRKYSSPVRANVADKLINLIRQIINALKSTSLKKELKWLGTRSQKFARFLGN